MINKYLRNLNRIEFLITYECISNCRHCSNGENKKKGRIDPYAAPAVIKEIAKDYDIKSVMTFGGEPLLYPESIYQILSASRDVGIRTRQLITNGGAWSDEADAKEQAANLISSGVNEVLVSVDVFHNEFISYEKPYFFVRMLKDLGFENIKLSPAWLKGPEDINNYNEKTKKILKKFDDLNIETGDGNVIFPAGNAIRNFKAYFTDNNFDRNFHCGDEAYTDPLDDIKSISVDPDGSIYGCSICMGNVNNKSTTEILSEYDPENSIVGKILIHDGISGLIDFAERELNMNCNDYQSPCILCREVCERLK